MRAAGERQLFLGRGPAELAGQHLGSVRGIKKQILDFHRSTRGRQSCKSPIFTRP